MNRSLLTSAAFAALIAGPALAQQTGTNPNVPGATPGAQQPSVTAPGATRSPSATTLGAEMTAEDLQGMVVYTTKVEGNAGTVRNDAVKTGTVNAPATTGTSGNTATGTLGANSNTTSNTTSNTASSSTVASGISEVRTLSKAELKTMTDRARSIGEINDLLIGTDGRVQHAIIDVGGFLGIGERPVTLAWQDLKIVRTSEGDIAAFVDISRADLNNMPQYRAPARR